MSNQTQELTNKTTEAINLEKLAAAQDTLVREIFVPAFVSLYNEKIAQAGMVSHSIRTEDDLNKAMSIADYIMKKEAEVTAAQGSPFAKAASAISKFETGRDNREVNFVKAATRVPAVLDAVGTLTGTEKKKSNNLTKVAGALTNDVLGGLGGAALFGGLGYLKGNEDSTGIGINTGLGGLFGASLTHGIQKFNELSNNKAVHGHLTGNEDEKNINPAMNTLRNVGLLAGGGVLGGVGGAGLASLLGGNRDSISLGGGIGSALGFGLPGLIMETNGMDRAKDSLNTVRGVKPTQSAPVDGGTSSTTQNDSWDPSNHDDEKRKAAWFAGKKGLMGKHPEADIRNMYRKFVAEGGDVSKL